VWTNPGKALSTALGSIFKRRYLTKLYLRKNPHLASRGTGKLSAGGEASPGKMGINTEWARIARTIEPVSTGNKCRSSALYRGFNNISLAHRERRPFLTSNRE